MSTKRFEEVQSITVTVEKHVCDLCEKVISADTPAITIQAVKLPHTSPLLPSRGRDWSDQRIEVCSVDCLTKNIRGVSILLNTKIIPAMNSSKSGVFAGEKACDSYPVNPVNIKDINYH